MRTKCSRRSKVFSSNRPALPVWPVRKLAAEGYFDSVSPGEGDRIRIVCILTGHGLKDPDAAVKSVEEPTRLPAEEAAVLEAIGL